MVQKVNLFYRRSINNQKADIDIDCSKKWVRQRGTHTKLLCGFNFEEDAWEGPGGRRVDLLSHNSW